MAAQFVSADPAALQQIVRKPVGSGGLWFHDMGCARQFSLPGEIVASQLTSFARCLSGLHVRVGDRKDPLSDVVVLTYDPGIEIEARFLDDEHGPWLAWIGFESRRDLRDGLPTISAAALEVLRSSGSRDGTIDDATGATLLAHAHAFNQKSEFAWIKACLDTDGNVTGAHVRQASSIAVAEAFVASVKAWTFHPMLIDGHPIPVCAMVDLDYPATEHPKEEWLPLPLPEAPVDIIQVPFQVLGKRIAGETQLMPSPYHRTLLHEAAITKVIVAYQYCLDETGSVASVSQIRSSGLREYDKQLEAAIKGWRYRPYDEGRGPVRVCSSVSFTYTQR